MGGGGAMRTAGKVAGISVAGIRGALLAPPAEQSLRKASMPASAVVSSQAAKTSANEVAAPVYTAASWDMDDWEFPDESELFMQAGEPTPRVVFGAVPSFQEAKEATTELKEAIDQVYLSSSSSNGCEASYDDVFVQSPHSELETKYGVTDLIPTPSVPNHALQAFRYLSGSNEAQTVVASLVSDANVWNAVMENPVLKDFLQSQKKDAAFELEKTSVKLEELPDSEETSKPRNGFIDDFNGILQNIQLTVTEMLSSVSKYLQGLFGFSEPEKKGSHGDGNPGTSITDNITMKTFMGFAVLVGMVVLIKRG